MTRPPSRPPRVTGHVAGTGYLNLDLDRGEATLSRGAASILGVPFARMPIASLRQFVLPRDRAHLDGLLGSVLDGRPARAPCVRLRSAEGGLRHVRIALDLDIDIDSASTTRATLVVTDVTPEIARQTSLDELTSMLRAAEQMAHIGHWRFRIGEESLYWSDEIYRIHGYEPGEVEPTLALGVASYHPEDRPALERAMAAGEAWELELRLVRRDGKVHWVRAKGAMLRDAENQVIEHFGVFQSIDVERQRDEHLHRLSEVVELTSEAVLLTDARGKMTWGNGGFRRLTGFSLEDCIGRGPGELLQGPETDPTTVAFMKEKMAAREPFVCEVRNYTKAGDPHWIHLSVQPRFEDGGQLAGFVSVQFDITAERAVREALSTKSRDLEHAVFRLERQKVELTRLATEQQRAHDALRSEAEENERLTEQLQRLVLSDALTALPNRRHFFEDGRRELSRARRYARACSVVMIDIDLFKRINDQWGHGVGDRALCHVATVLRSEIQRSADLLARIGGEELGLLLPDTDEGGAIILAERLRAALERAPLSLSDDSITITASFGVTELSAFDTSLDELLVRADRALYRAKALGRNRCELEPAPASRRPDRLSTSARPPVLPRP